MIRIYGLQKMFEEESQEVTTTLTGTLSKQVYGKCYMKFKTRKFRIDHVTLKQQDLAS